MNTINVARQFTKFPSGRYASKGSTSGESFRQLFLEPALQRGEPIKIELDGVIGYGSSFLEEAFGGAVRTTGLSYEKFFNLVQLSTSNQAWIDEIKEYVKEASKAPNNA